MKMNGAALTACVSFQAQDLPVAAVGQHPHQRLGREAHHVLENHKQTLQTYQPPGSGHKHEPAACFYKVPPCLRQKAAVCGLLPSDAVHYGGTTPVVVNLPAAPGS